MSETELEPGCLAADEEDRAAPRAAPRLRDACGTLNQAWYVAATSAELRDGRPLAREILEERLVLFRDGQGRPAAFRDRCLHRNAELSEGRVERGLLQCPYHGWTYDRAGQCVRIPSESPETTRLPRRRLPVFPVREQDGLVWVWLGDPERITREPFRMPHWDTPGWQRYYMVTDFDGDVTDCAENFMDVPHTVFVHAGWFRSERRREIRAEVVRTEDSVLVTYHQPNDSIGFSRWLLNPKNEPMVHTDKFYFPNVTRVDYDFGGSRSFIITSQCTPVAPLKTRVYTLISFRLGHPLLDLAGRFLLPPYTRQVIQQDVEIMANQTRSLRRYGAEFLHGNADLIHRWIESLRDWAARGEVGPRPRPAKGEIVFRV